LINGNNGCRSFTTIDHRKFSEMSARIDIGKGDLLTGGRLD
tara:strand:+ start:545 stop:667 length:123 start_codon:yes stop_codon:yes gene_type:complete